MLGKGIWTCFDQRHMIRHYKGSSMTKCGFCSSTIILGGVRSGDHRFCNNKCLQNAYILSVGKEIPREALEQKVEEVWRGACPQCKGRGPVDVHKVYAVWSALVMTRWSTKSQVSCHRCARNQQIGGVFFSLLFGWWGFPWGLILTPVQISRNIAGICGGPDRQRPSDGLKRAVLVSLAGQVLAAQQAAKPPISK
jgi:hypothetical protein